MGSGKSWRRRLRSPISCALVLSLAVHCAASAQPAEQGVATLEAFLDQVDTLTADFTQEIYDANQRLQQTETGTLELSRPNRFRWTYQDPTELVVVADGERLWIYDVELEQVTVTPFDDSVGASPAMLLSGDRGVRDEFDVVQSLPADGLDWIKLEPTGASDFASIRIGFDGIEPRRLELVDGLGEVTRIVLDNLVVNPVLPVERFELDVPSGVDVIGNEG